MIRITTDLNNLIEKVYIPNIRIDEDTEFFVILHVVDRLEENDMPLSAKKLKHIIESELNNDLIFNDNMCNFLGRQNLRGIGIVDTYEFYGWKDEQQNKKQVR